MNDKLINGLIIIGMYSFILGIALNVIWTIPTDYEIKEVNCYDKYGNEIKELTCEQEIAGIPIYAKYMLSGFVILMVIIFAITTWRTSVERYGGSI